MATRSHIYVEQPGGRHIGVYCHYDGYPSHMVPELLGYSHRKVYEVVLGAGVFGGLRTLDGGRAENLEENQVNYLFDPEVADHVDYVYIKKLCGEVKYRVARDEGLWSTCKNSFTTDSL